MSPETASAAQVRAFIDQAPEITTRDTWPEPDTRLIDDDRAPAPSLDDDALPAGWGSWIATEAAARACPRDYVAAGLIGTASAWIGNARRIAPTTEWIEPAHIWMALIGSPSTGKTPALDRMIKASRCLELDAKPDWQKALNEYERKAEAARVAHEIWRDEVRKAAKENAAPPDRPAEAEAPNKPPMPRVMAMNSTTEKLELLLAENPRGLLCMRDELAGWLGGFDRYGGDGADRAFFLECWNGGLHVSDRVKFNDVPVRVEHASLAIVGGMVPDRLRKVLGGADDGLAERLFFIWPEPVPIAPLCERGATDAAERRNMLHTAAAKLHELNMGADDHGQPTPIALKLDPDAVQVFDDIRREAMTRARSEHGLVAGWHGKNQGRALRLALVFELLAWAVRGDGSAEPGSVSADAVVRAGGFIDYACAMFERVIGGLAIGRAEADAAQIARRVLAIAQAAPPRARLKPLNERSLYQTRGFAWARAPKRRAEAFVVLCNAGWLKPPQSDGHGRPRGDWQVNPRIVDLKQ